MPARTSCFALAFALALLGCARFAAAAAPSAAQAQAVPALEGWVNDDAGVLTAAQRQKLSDLLADYHSETHHQLAVLTITTLAGEPLESYSLRVASAWALGYRGLDNGILVLLAMKERRVRIELGKGMARYISDAQAQAIIDESMLPQFSRGDFTDGLERGLRRLMDAARRYVVRVEDLPAD